MSVTTLTKITCDASVVKLSCHLSATMDLSVANTRRELVKQGWTYRHSGDRKIDLCPNCSPIAVLEPHTNGRPKKVV